MEKRVRGVELFTEGTIYKSFNMNTTGSEKKVMMSILDHMERDMNHIIINGDTLDSMMKYTDMSKQQVRDAVSTLKRLHVIEPLELRAEYIVNPTFAIRGSYKKVWEFYSEMEQRLQNK